MPPLLLGTLQVMTLSASLLGSTSSVNRQYAHLEGLALRSACCCFMRKFHNASFRAQLQLHQIMPLRILTGCGTMRRL